MAGEWKKERLSALCVEIADCPHSTPLWTDGGALVLRSQNIRNGRLDLSAKSYTDEAHFEQRSRRARLRGGDLVITREAPMGEVCLIPDGLRCCLGQRMVMLRPDPKKCDSRFLLYSIQSRAVQDEIKVNEGTGSTVSNLRIPLLEALPISHPPLAEQKAIAAVLGALDDKIESSRRMNATLEAMARTLFQSWFVNFDPVRAKLDGRKPLGIDETTAALFPDSLQDSGSGDIPRGWKCGTIGELGARILEKVDGQANWASEPLIDLSRMPQRSVALGEWGLGVELTTSVTRFLPKDVLFGAIRPYFHKVGIAPVPGVTNVSVFVVRAKQSFDWAFLAALCSLDSTIEFATRVSRGTKMPVIGWPDFANYPIVVPPPGLRRAFADVVAPLYGRIIANVHQFRTLAALRNTLLPKLLSGEVKVPVED